MVSRGRVGFPFRVPETARIVLQFQEMLWLVHGRLYKENRGERVAGLCFQNRFVSVNQRFYRKDPFLF